MRIPKVSKCTYGCLVIPPALACLALYLAAIVLDDFSRVDIDLVFNQTAESPLVYSSCPITFSIRAPSVELCDFLGSPSGSCHDNNIPPDPFDQDMSCSTAMPGLFTGTTYAALVLMLVLLHGIFRTSRMCMPRYLSLKRNAIFSIFFLVVTNLWILVAFAVFYGSWQRQTIDDTIYPNILNHIPKYDNRMRVASAPSTVSFGQSQYLYLGGVIANCIATTLSIVFFHKDLYPPEYELVPDSAPDADAPSINVAREQRPLPASFDVFLSHSWGPAQETHARVKDIYQRLSEVGIVAFLDEAYMQRGTSIDDVMARAIERARVFVIFLTQAYMDKVNDETYPPNNVRMEFMHALSRAKPYIVVVLEPALLDQACWAGVFAFKLQGRPLYVNMTTSNDTTELLQRLYD